MPHFNCCPYAIFTLKGQTVLTAIVKLDTFAYVIDAKALQIACIFSRFLKHMTNFLKLLRLDANAIV